MTLKPLGAKTGYTDVSLLQLWRRRADPAIIMLRKIASALQTKVVDFFLDSHHENDVVLRLLERR